MTAELISAIIIYDSVNLLGIRRFVLCLLVGFVTSAFTKIHITLHLMLAGSTIPISLC